MIKRIRFVDRRAERTTDDLAAGLRVGLRVAASAPGDVRPSRIAVCLADREVIAEPLHDAIGLEWFDDLDHLERFHEWLATPDGQQQAAALDQVQAVDTSQVVETAEHIKRGADWLDVRWRRGGEARKHLAIARRAADLTPAEFTERWNARAGQVSQQGGAALVAIPDDVRGQAYVQNQLLPRTTGEWVYDAVNEVYFEDEAGLRRRVRWFDEHLGERPEEDLVSASWFLAAREEVLFERSLYPYKH